MKIALGAALLGILAGCCHAPPEHHPAPTPEVYTLPWQARSTDRFCVQPVGLEAGLQADEARGVVCTSVASLRLWMRTQRQAN